ncbi:hypothetical protein ACFTRD_04180 [Paenibacillus sp. NPDC056933]|uniref:hypothetical protein n=1 Tax=Paenibacillus sp. NPDC056933 TaxID=3345968 RepID=UPI00363E25F0
MNMLIIALVMWLAVGLVLLVQGLKKKSPLTLFFGVISILAPILTYMGWLNFLPFVSPAALAIAYLGKKKTNDKYA